MSARICWTLGCCAMLHGSVLLAGAKSDVPTSAGVVASTLSAELAAADNQRFDRRSQLSEGRNDKSNAAAWWQSGYVSAATGWQSWDASAIADSELLRRYQEERAATSSTAAAQLKLADWCRDAGLKDQERAHLIQAIKAGQVQNPEGLMGRLGYRRVGSLWMTDAELAKAAESFAALAKPAKRVSLRLERIAERLEANPVVRDKARLELKSLANRETVWLMEQSLAGRSESAAQAVVDALPQVESYQSSQALARIAAFSPWDAVRSAAMDKLRTRRWEDFVPVLLEFLQEPVHLASNGVIDQSRSTGIRGLQEFRFLWTREGRHSIDAASSHLFYCRNVAAAPGFTQGQSAFERRVLRWKDQVTAADFAHWSRSQVEDANDQIQERNESVTTVLSAVTGLSAENSPTDWWKWWDGTVNQLEDSDFKPVLIVFEETQSFGLPEMFQRGPVGSCLVAGTPVWTEEGFQAIEDIRIGDRVLSKNTETGELKYQPVLHTTYRVGASVSELKIGDETIEASQGHNFWISGRGWTKTNQLQDGMPAHTPTGSIRLEIASPTRTADVYNLVVDEFHTYFVGKSMLLGHDVIVPAPTDIRVPGLDPNLTASK